MSQRLYERLWNVYSLLFWPELMLALQDYVNLPPPPPYPGSAGTSTVAHGTVLSPTRCHSRNLSDTSGKSESSGESYFCPSNLVQMGQE